VTEPIAPREDVRATIEAYRELGPTHEREVLDAFVDRLEHRLEARFGKQAQRHVGTDAGAVVLGVCTLVFAIPLLGIAQNEGAIAILAVVWLLLAVNVLYHRRPK
jgi:hypothetical protein